MILKCEILQSNAPEIEAEKERFGDMPNHSTPETFWTKGGLLIQAVDCAYECTEKEGSSVVVLQSGESVVVRIPIDALLIWLDKVDDMVSLENSSKND